MYFMEHNKPVIYFLVRYRKLLLAALVCGGFVAGGITFFLPKKYLSTAIVYPYNAHTKNDIVGNPQFGYEVETEQLLQLLESKSMRDRTIRKFRLYDYYKLDTNRRAWRSELTLRYLKDISFIRSRYLSVVINVQTTDPRLSAAIANYQLEEIDDYRKQVFDANRRKELRSVKKDLDATKKLLEQLRDSIYEIKSGDKELLYAFMENLNNENFDAGTFVDDPRLEGLVDLYVYEFGHYKELRADYDRKKEQYETPLPSVYAIDRAEPSYKKAAPSFTLNVAIGALFSMLLAMTIVLVRDRMKQVRLEMKI